MAKVKPHSIDKDIRYEMVSEFFDIISELKTKKDIVDFFIGTVTSSEILMIARRVQIAKKILAGRSYEEISQEMGVGYQTIARVTNWLYEGNDEYRELIDRNITKNKKNHGGRNYESMLGKYAHHRILSNLFK